MSLITLYTDIMKKYGVEYDIIYMDKYDEDEPFECAHKYRYVNVINQKWPKPVKAMKYMRFYGYATKILKREKYDFVIVWNDLAIFMLGGFLAKHYKGKYCLNVRDNMRYDRRLYQKRYNKIFAEAAFRTISSVGYKSFLPKNVEYIPIHSFNISVLDGMTLHDRMRREGEPIRIGFIGYVRYFERNKLLMRVFANDPRFMLCYYGKKADVLREYAEAEGITNVDFHDSFPVEDTKIYMEKIDVINNLYGNDTLNLQKAISIKFFHALYAKIPILVCDNTYVGEVAQEVGIGFEVKSIDEEMKERFYEWYMSRDFSEIDKSCATHLAKASEENKKFEEIAVSYLCDKGNCSNG